jgi:hypothetical protein
VLELEGEGLERELRELGPGPGGARASVEAALEPLGESLERGPADRGDHGLRADVVARNTKR